MLRLIKGFAKSSLRDSSAPDTGDLEPVLHNFSIEVMPRTAQKVENFAAILPQGTRVYIAHLPDVDFDDMVATAKRLTDEGMTPMPHITARLIENRADLEARVARYADEAGVNQALLLAGGLAEARGDYHSSMQLAESGIFDARGFDRLHFAGHPEGNRDIDKDGTRIVDEAARWKHDFAERTDAGVALVTQFAFEARPVLDWIARMRAAGVELPVHVGIAGPAKLQTLIRFAVECGVGPSIGVLKKRAADVTKLVKPYEPDEVMQAFARAHSAEGQLVEQFHFFPLGGIETCARWIDSHTNQKSRT
ncbi:methylenetetrahydrofolate reductase (NADPH) [Palleronia marisminoris]|uniref:methylenetetrahydrofolate reductase (NADH) n=1 Tax=Palleronia marisminoris TaxID=315423 RepID=A0A1Y5TKY2_9RHOB|nr:methylenetetrahydrofolate reductase [Palleronia marisminoris]SFH41576.1 methylenetetrahydrofolate reductase (NADPH) [Palleronia marisminoris]SLN65997.1 hypothetical protein PAM7066_03308 [Palleronia marisminoris]